MRVMMPAMRGLGLLGLVGLWLCVSLATAAAQTPAQQQADALFAEGRELLTTEDYQAACDKFEQAIAIDPTAPGVMLNLGLCYEKLEKYATSLYWFRKAQAAASEAQLKDYEDAAKDHTVTLATKVATAKIDVSAAPPDVAVTIDGRPVLPTEYRRIEVDAGSKVEARARGKQPFEQVIEVNGRDAGTIQIVMADVAVPKLIDPGKSRRRLGWGLVAGGVGLGLISGGYGLYVTKVQYDEGRGSLCDGTANATECFDRAEFRLQVIDTAIFAAGVAVAAAGVYLIVSAPKAYRESIDQSAIAPVVGPDQLGFVWSGAF